MVATPHIRSSFLTGPAVWRVEVRGIHDITAGGRLAVTLRRLASAGSPIVVDLTHARLVDGSVAGVLQNAQPGIEAANGCLLVVLPPARSDPELLLLPSGLDTYPSFEAALASLASARRTG